jgi:Protein of unknown function (DUF3487).
MSIEKEGTIRITLDGLDYEPPSVAGLTYKELMVVIVTSFIVSCAICTPLAYFVIGIGMLGPIIAVGVTIAFTVQFARKAYIWKKDRPSYLLWIEMQKKIQNHGVLGMKIPMGFIKTTYWHTGAKKG